jgi:hypothetical protein
MGDEKQSVKLSFDANLLCLQHSPPWVPTFLRGDLP